MKMDPLIKARRGVSDSCTTSWLQTGISEFPPEVAPAWVEGR